MSAVGTRGSAQLNKFRISRRGRKLQISDDQRTLLALPRDVPERTWAEILQKEENDLLCFDIREEIVEEALRIVYEHYMERNNALFAVHCAAQAWLKLIDWHFYRHDPGEEPSAYPPCYIPKRIESWVPDELPEPSPKDTWGRQDLNVVEEMVDDSNLYEFDNDSVDLPYVEEIPAEYWFPGKVVQSYSEELGEYDEVEGKRHRRRKQPGQVDSYESIDVSSEGVTAESEVLQKVTDYSKEELLTRESTLSALKTTTPVGMEGSLHGAGDSSVALEQQRQKRPSLRKGGKSFSRPRKPTHMVKGLQDGSGDSQVNSGSETKQHETANVPTSTSMQGRSKLLPPLDGGDSRSLNSIISDCRLRNLRAETRHKFVLTSDAIFIKSTRALKRTYPILLESAGG